MGPRKFPYGNYEIDFGTPFKRIGMYDAVVEFSGIPTSELAENTINATILKHRFKSGSNLSHTDKKFTLSLMHWWNQSLFSRPLSLSFLLKFHRLQNGIAKILQLLLAMNFLLRAWRLLTVTMSLMIPLIKLSGSRSVESSCSRG